MDGGILATLAVGIPYILTFYLILAVIEDSGYMNAAAFLSDRVMHRFGLHGRAVMPLIAAGGCNVPAVIATRTLSNPRERFIASVLATLTPCSARTAVIIGAVAGVAGWQYALLTYGVLLVVIVGAGLGLNRLLPGDESPLVMEMFPFRRPVVRQVLRKTWRRFREFVWDAAPIILLGSMALGALYETGLVWKLEPILAPVVQGWLMLPAVAGLTLLFAVLRKEMALQLLLVFAAVQAGGAVVSISSIMTHVADRHLRHRQRHLHPVPRDDRRARSESSAGSAPCTSAPAPSCWRWPSAASWRACCRSSAPDAGSAAPNTPPARTFAVRRAGRRGSGAPPARSAVSVPPGW